MTSRTTSGRLLALVASLAVLASAAIALTATGTAAASACGDRVLADWADNGRIDRLYPLRCYRDALDSIPADIRDYADAEDVIARALQDASRQGGPNGGPGDDGSGSGGGGGNGGPSNPVDPDPSPSDPSGDPVAVDPVNGDDVSSIPIPLILLAAMSLALLAAGGLGYLSRRRNPALAEDAVDLPDEDQAPPS